MLSTRWIALSLIPLLALGLVACGPADSSGEAPAAEEAAADSAAAEVAIDEVAEDVVADSGAAVEAETVAKAPTVSLICSGDLSAPEVGDGFVDLGSGVLGKDLVVGEGQLVEVGTLIQANYAGFLEDGSMFDSSCTRNATFPVTVGTGGVIQGWDLGLQGMKVGGRRVLVIPAAMAYGDGGIPQVGIGPGATLIFDVEVMSAQ